MPLKKALEKELEKRQCWVQVVVRDLDILTPEKISILKEQIENAMQNQILSDQRYSDNFKKYKTLLMTLEWKDER